jgi:hypothetical protein
MNSLTRFFNRYRRRTWLLGLAALLLLAKLGSMVLENYQEKVAIVETRQAILQQYRNLTANADELRGRLKRLQTNREKLMSRFFRGVNEEEIISAMQLNLQALVSTAGLQSESIRPMQQRGGRGAEAAQTEPFLGEVVIKARLVGSLSEYLEFLASLERSEKFFKIDNFSLAPYRKSELKITLDLRGYFVTIPSGEAGGSKKAQAATPVD